MKPLEPPHAHYLRAALGWLELGNRAEALAELVALEPEWQQHPDVLEAYWMIYAEGSDWLEASRVATALWQAAPKRASGWLHRAYALRRVPEGSLRQAWEALLPAFGMFPEEPIIPYNLACYACQMGELEEARRWLQRAEAVGGSEAIRKMALADPDLQPLWDELQTG